MALIHCDFFAETLGLSTSMAVILPQPTQGQIGLAGAAGEGRHPTLWLLHGMSDDHTIWQRRTAIERYVAPMGLAVVMPRVARSFYCDMHAGPRYWSFISEELPALARRFFPLSEAREQNFVAGLSMGGYGAMKLALAQPDCFAAGATLSGALDVATVAETINSDRAAEWVRIFGPLEQVRGSGNDLFALAEQAAAGGLCPRLYCWCGVDDGLYASNVRFRDHCAKLGLPLTYEEGPGGHTWDKWDTGIRRVLEWLDLGVAPAP